MLPMRVLAFPAMVALAAIGLASCGGPGDRAPASSNLQVPFQDSVDGRGWTQWGGPNGNFKVRVDGLADQWAHQGPVRLWSRSLGEGYSPIVAAGGALFATYRDGSDDVVIAMRAKDGELIWKQNYSAPTRKQNQTQFGEGPNASPLVAGNRLITLGYTGILNAFDLETGDVLWTHELIEEFNGEVLEFGYAASPVLFDQTVIVLVGGDDHAVIAIDPADGSVTWGSDPGRVSYSTPIIIDVEGQKQLVYFSPTAIVGLDAADGRTLWSHPCLNQYENNATGAIWGDDHLLWVPTQLDGGTRVLKLTRVGDATRVEQVWFNNKVSIHFWNSIRLGDFVYASIGSKASILAAVSIHTGEIVWRERGFEMVNFIDAGERTLFLDGEGTLAMVVMSPEGMRILAQAKIVDGVTWTVPTLVGTRLYVRDKKSIRALDLSREANSVESTDTAGSGHERT